MKTLSPKLASRLAAFAYQSNLVALTGQLDYGIGSNILSKNFDFSYTKQPIKGETGGVLCRTFNLKSGCCLVGRGQGHHEGDVAIIFRGTKNAFDGLTDLSTGCATAHNGAPAHMGFVRTFQSIVNELEAVLQPLLSDNNMVGTVHCVGHSLGGALATLCADWVKQQFHKSVKVIYLR